MDLLNEVSVVIPWRTDFGVRERAFNWNVERLQSFAPGIEVVTGDVQSPIFSYSGARNIAIQKANRRYLLLLDADVVLSQVQVTKALLKLDEGAPWVIPYDQYICVTERATEETLGQRPSLPINPTPETHIYANTGTAGAALFRQSDLMKVGGFDERFIGWGYEYRAFVRAAEVVIGEPERVRGQAQHLWHGQANLDSPFIHLNKALYERYRSIKNADDMRDFIFEGTTI